MLQIPLQIKDLESCACGLYSLALLGALTAKCVY